MGLLITLVLIALGARSFINAIKDDRPAKAILFAVITAMLLVFFLHGGLVSVGRGVGVDVDQPAP
jgi:hypothetical protein